MANDDAWASGWAQGSGAAQKRKDKKDYQSEFGGSKKKVKPLKQVTTSDGQTLTPSEPLKAYHKGGKVKKTGPAILKKNEIVLTAKQAQKAGIRKKAKKSGTNKRTSSKG